MRSRAALALLLTASAAPALTVRLHESAAVRGGEVRLGEIAEVRGEGSERLEGLVVAREPFAGGVVTVDQVMRAVGRQFPPGCVVLGRSVRLWGAPAVRSGGPVRVSFRARGVSISAGGIACEDGEVGQVIAVRLRGRRRWARVTGPGHAEVLGRDERADAEE